MSGLLDKQELSEFRYLSDILARSSEKPSQELSAVIKVFQRDAGHTRLEEVLDRMQAQLAQNKTVGAVADILAADSSPVLKQAGEILGRYVARRSSPPAL